MKKRVLFCLINFVFILLPFVASEAISSTLYVDGSKGRDYPFWGFLPSNPLQTISCAVERARENTTIYVFAGTYIENISIDKMITLDIVGEGAETTIIQGTGGAPVLLVQGPNRVTISGFTLEGGEAGIAGVGGAQLAIHDLVIQNNSSDGIFINSASMTNIRDSQILNNGRDGVLIVGAWGRITNSIIEANDRHGICVYHSGEAFIGLALQEVESGNIIRGNNQDGITVSGAANAVICGNQIQNNIRHGIGVFNASTQLIGQNIIEENQDNGIWVDRGTFTQGKQGFSITPNHDRIERNEHNGIVGFNNAAFDISDITVNENKGNGIVLDLHSTLKISNSDIQSNIANGILVVRDSGLLLGQDSPITASDNGGADIECASDESSIAGNTDYVGNIGGNCTGF